jgi:uncharacterized membrane protein
MEPSPLHYMPLTWPFYLALAVLLAVLFVLLGFNVFASAYRRMGVNAQLVMLVLLASWLGGMINIPVAQLPAEKTVDRQVVTVYGVQYVVPVVHHWPGTIIAVNVGGAVIPTLLSLYLIIRNRLYLRALLGIAAVSLVVHFLARPVPGLGITMPTLLPPVVAALAALFLSLRKAPALAYISGTMGTLIGADLLNLHLLQGMGAPVASIGGAGTFDGIFMTGVLAVLLVWTPPGRGDGLPPENEPNQRQQPPNMLD